MSEMVASIWVEATQDDNKMLVTVAIEGQETEVYLMNRNIWESMEPSIRDGRLLSRWMTRDDKLSKVTAAKGTVNTRELDVSP